MVWKTTVAAIGLALIAGFIAAMSSDPFSHDTLGRLVALPMFFCILIVVSVGIVLHKLNEVSRKLDSLLSKEK